MTISGFSYVRNGLEMGYPFLESILSVLSVCDEFVIAVGDSHDGTRQAIQELGSDKIKIIDTVWEPHLQQNGKIFAQQTNLALDQTKGDWALHIQADEVIHEGDLHKIRPALEKYSGENRVEGFIQPFYHFWGSYDYIRTSRKVHRYEVRIFKNSGLVRSYRDSQGFRKYISKASYEQGEKGSKLGVKILDVPIYHYNAVRPLSLMKKKVYAFDSYYDSTVKETQDRYSKFDYQKIDRLEKFNGTHPAVMDQKRKLQHESFVYDPKKAVWKLKDRIMQPIEDWLGFKIGEYKNYKLIRK